MVNQPGAGQAAVVAAVRGVSRTDADFFPLTVDYIEKFYAAGRIPGGFFKREGRPTERETLVARLTDRPAAPMERHQGAYYMRLMVQDRPGVIAAVSGALAKERISLESMLQRGRSQSGEVPVVLTTHETEERAMQRALARIAKLGAVAEPPCLIRIESF